MSYEDDANKTAAEMEHNHAPRAPRPIPEGPVRERVAKVTELVALYNRGILAHNALVEEISRVSAALELLQGTITGARREMRDALEAHFGPDFTGCYTIDPGTNEVVFMDHIDQPAGTQPEWARKLAEDLGGAN